MDMKEKMQKIVESLSPDERKIIAFLNEKTLEKISEKAGADKTKTLRALEFLSNKALVKLKEEKEKIIDLGDNGVIYLKNSLPERKLLNLLAENKTLNLEDAQKQAKLSENELKAAIGALKKKAMISLQSGKLILTASMEEVAKKSLEEQFLEVLPLSIEGLTNEQKYAFENLKPRKNIIQVIEKKKIQVEITELGKNILGEDLSKAENLIETLTPEMLKSLAWKGKRFRRYDIKSPVPEIHGGKKHFVNQAIEYARKIWLEMGFEEMTGSLCQLGFWNFDALFTAQDHPVREMQDTFYIKELEGKLPEQKLVKKVKESHERGVERSKGWQYSWQEEEAKKVVLRTHTTCLSAITLSKLKEKKGKFFAIGKCFRNETLDINHLFELTQTEGIVVGEDANLRNLIGYLAEFYKKMGYEKIRVRPSYFPYTEPSLEIDVYDTKQGRWIELGGAGIFRPEVVVPLFGEYIPVLAWGQGFERIIREYFKISDLREMYQTDLNKIRKMRVWIK